MRLNLVLKSGLCLLIYQGTSKALLAQQGPLESCFPQSASEVSLPLKPGWNLRDSE